MKNNLLIDIYNRALKYVQTSSVKKAPPKDKPIISCRDCGYYEAFPNTWGCEADIRDLEHTICFQRRELAALDKLMIDVNSLTTDFDGAEET